MRILPLASHSPSVVRDVLAERGLDAVRADASALGVVGEVILVEDVTAAVRDAVAVAARRHGVECLTGEGWMVLAGGRARLAGMARPGGTLPGEVADRLGAAVGGALEPVEQWQTARGALSLERPLIAGIVNVTPDSFSDGGRYLDPVAAADHAERLVGEGADLLDVGAQSTRPGRPEPVPLDEEWRRLEPVLTGVLARCPDVPVSVDTVKEEIARRALEAGAWAVNDVSGLRLEPGIADRCAEYGAGLILMHSRGSTSDMATFDHARYGQVAAEVHAELAQATAEAERRGVPRSHLVVDPGLGFAKESSHTLSMLRDLPVLRLLGCPIMVGPSRKRFLGAVTDRPVEERDHATAVACALACLLGAHLFRVHAPAPAREALAIAQAVRTGHA